jgi:hypothetical protein
MSGIKKIKFITDKFQILGKRRLKRRFYFGNQKKHILSQIIGKNVPAIQKTFDVKIPVVKPELNHLLYVKIPAINR